MGTGFFWCSQVIKQGLGINDAVRTVGLGVPHCSADGLCVVCLQGIRGILVLLHASDLDLARWQDLSTLFSSSTTRLVIVIEQDDLFVALKQWHDTLQCFLGTLCTVRDGHVRPGRHSGIARRSVQLALIDGQTGA